MAKHTAYDKGTVESRLVHEYNADLLGAPFKIVLVDSVTEEYCSATGEKLKTVIPDMSGLLRKAAFYRAIMPRKLVGEEIKFLRNAISYKAKQMADALEMTPEHYSRVENGSKRLMPDTEKLLRVIAITKMFEDKIVSSALLKNMSQLLNLKIEGAWDPSEMIELRLEHRKQEEQEETVGPANDNADWVPFAQARVC